MISIYNLFESINNDSIIFDIYNKVIKKILKLYNWNLSYMTLELSNKCINNDGTINKDMDTNSRGGNWTKFKVIYLATYDHFDNVMKYYDVKMDKLKFIELLISHELGHEIYRNILTNKEKEYFTNLIKKENFTSVYLKHVKPDKLQEESFCEYLASKIIESK